MGARPGSVNSETQRPELLWKAIKFQQHDNTLDEHVHAPFSDAEETALICIPSRHAAAAMTALPALVLGSQVVYVDDADDAACFIVYDSWERLQVHIFISFWQTTYLHMQLF